MTWLFYFYCNPPNDGKKKIRWQGSILETWEKHNILLELRDLFG